MLSSDPSFKPDAPPKAAPAKPAVPVTPPAPTTASSAATTSIPPENVPKGPPPPTSSGTGETAKATATASSRRFRRLRALLYLAALTLLGYSGAVFLALRNDNFHDFFTEYVPFGENAVLYFEERAFHKRFPNAKTHVYKSTSGPREEDKKVKIPLRSGLSWKAVDDTKPSGTDVSQRGKHISAVSESNKEEAKQTPDDATVKERSAAVIDAKKESSAPSSDAKKEEPKGGATPAIVKTEEPKAGATPVLLKSSEPAPKSDTRPPAIAPVTSISPVKVPNAEEPVVQELVKIINDLITVVNADEAAIANKYSAPMQKAKDSLAAVAGKISALRDAERAAAEERIKDAHREFDEGAKKLLERIETAQREDDIKYREEFESERAKIAQQYEQRLKAEIERTQQVLEQRHKNEILKQGLQMKQKFIDDIKGLVEAERDGRLSKLTDLSTNVDSLTQLTSNWNGIIDANLATQKLQVAVDAVRSVLDDSNTSHRPRPFVREMAALKLVADNDPVVDAAIAAINPAAYQKGIPSSAQLIDRFRRVSTEVRKASLLPEDAGIASHAASFLLSKVMFKKHGVPEGNDVESILTRAETLLEEGDLDNAAREMNELKGWAGVLSRDWLNDVRKVLEVKQALEVIETEARLQCLRVE